MWIRCENGEILNGDRCDRFSTGAAAQVREVNLNLPRFSYHSERGQLSCPMR